MSTGMSRRLRSKFLHLGKDSGCMDLLLDREERRHIHLDRRSLDVQCRDRDHMYLGLHYISRHIFLLGLRIHYLYPRERIAPLVPPMGSRMPVM